MNRTSAQRIVFVFIVLALILITERGRDSYAEDERQPILKKIEATSLASKGSLELPDFPIQFGATAIATVPGSGGVRTGPAPRGSQSEKFSGTAFLIKEVGGEEVLGWYAARRWPTASLAKLMTAVTALELMGPDQEIVMTERAIATAGDLPLFHSGEVFTVHDLVVAMMRASSNDAAVALAEGYGRPEFMEFSRRKAEKLGMTNTYFFDESGLSYLNQSTAEDLSRLAEYILVEHPEIFALSSVPEMDIIERVSGVRRPVLNINQFAGRPGFKGGKTGYTEDAGGNLLSVFEIKGRTYLLIVFGAENRFGETQKLYGYLAGR